MYNYRRGALSIYFRIARTTNFIKTYQQLIESLSEDLNWDSKEGGEIFKMLFNPSI